MTTERIEPSKKGAILASKQIFLPVHSDNAMIDSGAAIEFEVWDGKRRHYEAISTGRTASKLDIAKVNATEADRVAAANYTAASGFCDEVRNLARTFGFAIRKGSYVTVHRGRRCPMGEYEAYGPPEEGAYGPYVDLRSDEGKSYSYVSVSNLTPEADWRYAAEQVNIDPKHPHREAIVNLIESLMASDFSEFSWKLLAEYVEEKGIDPCDLPAGDAREHDDAEYDRWHTDTFCEWVRKLVSPSDPAFDPRLLVKIGYTPKHTGRRGAAREYGGYTFRSRRRRPLR